MLKMDAADSAFVLRQLEYVNEKMFSVDFPAVKWRQFIPLSSAIPAGAESYIYRQEELIGEAKVSDTYASDAPLTEVKVEEFPNKIVPVLNSYEFSVQDVRNAQLSGYPLDARKAMGARELVERKIDQLMALGSTDHGFTGFLNNADVPQDVVASNGTGTTWAVKTVDERMEDIFTAIQTMLDATNGAEGEGVDLVLPPKQYNMLLSTRVADVAMNGLAYLMTNVPAVKSVGSWHRLKDAGLSGTAVVDRMVVYTRDPLKLEGILPLQLNTLPPEARGFVYRVGLEARCGGTVFYKPFSAAYWDGI
jgi:hypothetical protein